MIIYTTHVSKWRQFQNTDITFVDTTVKTGNHVFAPTWDIVLKFKNNEISFEVYEKIYLEILKGSWVENRKVWDELLDTPKVALGCYCKPGDQCHRLLLKDVLLRLHKRLGHDIIDGGEI